jgi:uncharacterized membrane protein YfcA
MTDEVFDFNLVQAAILLASLLTGMLGIGVAFLAIPILSLGNPDLVGSVQPLALLLNGVSAMAAAIAFAAKGWVDWRKAAQLAACMSLAAPLGALASGMLPVVLLWLMFYAAVVAALWLLFARPSSLTRVSQAVPLNRTLAASIPIAFGCSMLGVGPGFLMVPMMMRAGYPARNAAALHSVAVVPCSFVALGMHLYAGARIDASAGLIVLATALGALGGGLLASRIDGERPLRIIFAIALVGMCGYKGFAQWRHTVAPASTTASVSVSIASGNLQLLTLAPGCGRRTC